MKNLLHEFFNSSSDSNQFLEATQQEQLENDFNKFQKSKASESFILEITDNMATESLSPDLFSKWEEVKYYLFKNRRV